MFVTNSFTIKKLSWLINNKNQPSFLSLGYLILIRQCIPIPFFNFRFIKYGHIENITALDTFNAFYLTHLSPTTYIMKRRENLLNTFASTY